MLSPYPNGYVATASIGAQAGSGAITPPTGTTGIRITCDAAIWATFMFVTTGSATNPTAQAGGIVAGVSDTAAVYTHLFTASSEASAFEIETPPGVTWSSLAIRNQTAAVTAGVFFIRYFKR